MTMAPSTHDDDLSSALARARAISLSQESLPASLESVMREHLRRYFAAHEGALPPAGLYDRVLALVERPLIQETLVLTGCNQLQAAALLGINRNTLRKKMRELGVVAEKER